MAGTPEELRSGQQILHYRLVEKLGEGGMGVVWKATDSSLDRPVALKALPPAFSADTERLARFEREARLLASLNHPNIATVYSVHQLEGVRYLSMELVPGEDLSQRIARGAVPVAEALELARQIALALEAAHESGVVHRDLKPANIRITPDGRVKVLDIGLANALETDVRSSSLSASPTYALSAMTSGMIIGTAAYMSPEQARGQGADRRADIWSFGVVLYEMLTGTRAFDGETVSDTLAAVLRAEPDRSLLPRDLPVRVRTLLDRCLEKSARRRLRDIGEAVLTLEDVLAGGGAEAGAPAAPATAPPPAGIRALWPLAVAVLALITAGVAWMRPGPSSAPLRKLTLALQTTASPVQLPVLSPDGAQLAYLQGSELWVRDFTQLTSRRLAEGLDEDFRPVWSPDGASIAFATGNALSRVSVTGGAISQVCTAQDFTGGAGGAWRRDGRILFTRGSDHIYQVAQGGGVPSVLVARIDSTEGDLHHPLVLPGKGAIVCILHTLKSGPTVLAVVEPGKRRPLLTVTSGLLWNLEYDPRGYLIYGRLGDGAGIWALPFSLKTLKTTGEPFMIAPEGGSPSIASNGSLAYRLGVAGLESHAIRLNRSGAVLDTLGRPSPGLWSLMPSPDGRSLAAEIREAGEGDIWSYDLERGTEGRLAFGPGRQGEPAWSPDGRMLAYREFVSTTVMLAPADGSRSPRRFASGMHPNFTPDGKRILYSRQAGDNRMDIWIASVESPGDSMAVLATPAEENFPAPAPQAPFMAYESDESGQLEVYLKPYPQGEGRWQVSVQGGEQPLWNRTGDRLYYYDDSDFYEVEVQLTPTVRLGTPRVIFRMGPLRLRTFGRYTVLPTGNPNQFFAIQNTGAPAQSPNDAIVVENWPAEFTKRK